MYSNTEKELIEEAVTGSSDIGRLNEVRDILDKYDMSRHIPFLFPVNCNYRISSRYGSRIHPISGKHTWHTGIDIAVELATPVYATADGTITYASLKGGYGRCIIIKHKYGFSTLYAHLIAYYTKVGEKVKQGEAIGFAGSTGRSTGNHLHYEIRKNNKPINPQWHEHK